MRREFVRFLLVGTINTLLSWVLFVVFVRFVPYIAAYTLSYGLSIIGSYFLNVRFVFKGQASLAAFIRFPLVYLVQYTLGILLMWLMAGYMSLRPELAMVIVIGVSVPITFLMSKKIIRPRTVD